MRLSRGILTLLVLLCAADGSIFDTLTKAFIKGPSDGETEGAGLGVKEALMAAQAAADAPDLATAFRNNPDGISTSHVRDPKGEKRAKRIYKTPDQLPLVKFFRRTYEVINESPLVQVGVCATATVLLICVYQSIMLSAKAASIERKRDNRKERIQQRKRDKQPQEEEPKTATKSATNKAKAASTASAAGGGKLKPKATPGQQLAPDEVKQIIQQRRERALAKKQVPGIKQQLTPKRKSLKIDTAAE